MDIEKVFEEIKAKRGGLASIHTAFREFPHGVKAHFDFYEQIMLEKDRPLPRSEREWLAVHTSKANECPYCIGHHQAAFDNHADGMDSASARMKFLAELATVLTKEPWKTSVYHTKSKEMMSEAEWQHAVFVISYFNLANRVVHAMGLDLEENFKETCK